LKVSNRTKGFCFSSTAVFSEIGSKVISNAKYPDVLIAAVRKSRHANNGHSPEKLNFSKDFVDTLIS
jgi:hypothetical protein